MFGSQASPQRQPRRTMVDWTPDDEPVDDWLARWLDYGWRCEYPWAGTACVVNGRDVVRYALSRDEWRLPALSHPDPVPSVGPVVYLVIADSRCLYVGQTGDLAGRFRRHMSNRYRRARWLAVAAIKLRGDVPGPIVSRLGCGAAKRLSPVDGSRWPKSA